MRQPKNVETTCILIWVWDQPQRNQYSCSIAPLNRYRNPLKQKCGITRIARDVCDPTAQLSDKFLSFRTNWAQGLDSDRHKNECPRQVRIFSDLCVRCKLGSCSCDMNCTVQVRIRKRVRHCGIPSETPSFRPWDHSQSIRTALVRAGQTSWFHNWWNSSTAESTMNDIVQCVMASKPASSQPTWKSVCPSRIHNRATRTSMRCTQHAAEAQPYGHSDRLVIQSEATGCNWQGIEPVSCMGCWNPVRHCGLVVSTPAWDGTGCEFDSWQCRIYIPCSLSLRLLGSFGFSGYIWLDTKIVLKKKKSKTAKSLALSIGSI